MGAHHQHAGHAHDRRSVSRKLFVAACCTVAFVLIETFAGWRAGSLSLLGDALHNLTDAVALLLAFVAVRMERRPATLAKTYGYQRAGILAAFINSGTLVAFTLYLFIEAAGRLRSPQPVNDRLMLITASAAVILNTVITVSLHRDGKHDVNIRGAVVHMLGDAISSAGIIVAALLIHSTGSPRWDPLVTLAIGGLILWSSWGILRETVNLLLDGTPSGIDPETVTHSLGTVEGVLGVHHLHIWALGPARPALSCHLMVGDVPLRDTGLLREKVTTLLHEEFGIEHATIQFEFSECAQDDPHCISFPVEVAEAASWSPSVPPSRRR